MKIKTPTHYTSSKSRAQSMPNDKYIKMMKNGSNALATRYHPIRKNPGKPLWLDTPGVHHIFFDDNFRPWTDNSILALRRRGVNGKWAPDESYAAADGVYAISANLLQSCVDRKYFVDLYDRAVTRFDLVKLNIFSKV